MKTEFCTYQIAKRLKDLGFNESCLMWWKNIDAEFYLAHQGEPSGIGTFDECDFYNKDGFPLRDTKIVTAPLHQQVIDWLWKQHEIWAEAFPLNVNEIYRYKYYVSKTGETLH